MCSKKEFQSILLLSVILLWNWLEITANEVEVLSTNFEFDENYVEKGELSWHGKNVTLLITFKQPIDDPKVVIDVPNCFNDTISLCNLKQVLKYHLFARVLLRSFMKQIDSKRICPLAKGDHVLHQELRENAFNRLQKGFLIDMTVKLVSHNKTIATATGKGKVIE